MQHSHNPFGQCGWNSGVYSLSCNGFFINHSHFCPVCKTRLLASAGQCCLKEPFLQARSPVPFTSSVKSGLNPVVPTVHFISAQPPSRRDLSVLESKPNFYFQPHAQTNRENKFKLRITFTEEFFLKYQFGVRVKKYDKGIL